MRDEFNMNENFFWSTAGIFLLAIFLMTSYNIVHGQFAANLTSQSATNE